MSNNTIRELLGITQEDMALLLKVSRSQLSLFELGKRSLPATAMIKLAEILSHIKKRSLETSEFSYENTKFIQKKKTIIEELLFLNKRKQMTLDKSTKAILKKQKNNEATLKLADYLKNSPDALDLLLYRTIEEKATHRNNGNDCELLFKNQLNKEVLLNEQRFLEDFLQKI